MSRLLPVAAALLAGAAAAQPIPATPPSTPFLEIGGTIRMDRLVVHQAGTVEIRLVGEGTVRDETRTNLPDRVRHGQTYPQARYHFRLALNPLLERLVLADSLLPPPVRRLPSPTPR